MLAICVTARSAHPGIAGWRPASDGREELLIRVAEAPSDGAANAAVLRLLAAALGVSRSELTMLSGQTSRHKRIAIPFALAEARGRLNVQ